MGRLVPQTSFEDFNVAAVLDYILRHTYNSHSQAHRIGHTHGKIGPGERWTVLLNTFSANTVLLPKVCSGLAFRFTRYNVILGVDVNKASFVLSTSLSFPFKTYVDGVKNTLAQLMSILPHLHAAVDLRILALSSDTDSSLLVWEGCLHVTSNTVALLESVNTAFQIAEKDIANILKTEPCANKEMPAVLRQLRFHLTVMSTNAFPVVFLFTQPDSFYIRDLDENQSLANAHRMMIHFALLASNSKDSSRSTILAQSTGGRVFQIGLSILNIDFFELDVISTHILPLNNQTMSIEDRPINHHDISFSAAVDLISLRISQGFRVTSIDEHPHFIEENLDVTNRSMRRRSGARDTTRLELRKNITKMTTIKYDFIFEHTPTSKAPLNIKSSYSVLIITPHKIHLTSLQIPITTDAFFPYRKSDEIIFRWWKLAHHISSLLLTSKDAAKISSFLHQFFSLSGTLNLMELCSANRTKTFLLLHAQDETLLCDISKETSFISRLLNFLNDVFKVIHFTCISSNCLILTVHHEASSIHHTHILALHYNLICNHYFTIYLYDLRKVTSIFTMDMFHEIFKCISHTLHECDIEHIPLSLDLSILCTSPMNPYLDCALSCHNSIQLCAIFRFENSYLFSLVFDHLIQCKLNADFMLISSECSSPTEQKTELHYVCFVTPKDRHSVINCMINRNNDQVFIEYYYEKESACGFAFDSLDECDRFHSIDSIASFVEKHADLFRHVLLVYGIIAPLYDSIIALDLFIDKVSIDLVIDSSEEYNVMIPIVRGTEIDNRLNTELMKLLQSDLILKMNIGSFRITSNTKDFAYGRFVFDTSLVIVRIPLSVSSDSSEIAIRCSLLNLPLSMTTDDRHKSILSSLFHEWFTDLKMYIYKTHLLNLALVVYRALLDGTIVPRQILDVVLSAYWPNIAEIDITILCSLQPKLHPSDMFHSTIGRYLLDSNYDEYFLTDSQLLFHELSLKSNFIDSVNISTAIFVTLELFVVGADDSETLLVAKNKNNFPQDMQKFLSNCYIHKRYSTNEIKLRMTCKHKTTLRDYLPDVDANHDREKQRELRMKCLQTLQTQLNQFVSLQFLSTLASNSSILSYEAALLAQDSMDTLLAVSIEKFVFDIISPQMSTRMDELIAEDILPVFISEVLKSLPLERVKELKYFLRNWQLDDTLVPCWVTASILPIASQSKSGNFYSIEIILSVKVLDSTEESQSRILRTIRLLLEAACHTLNQRHLLKNMHTSKNALPLLIPIADKQSVRSVVRQDSIIDSSDSQYFTKHKAFKPGCFECPSQGEITCALPSSAAVNHETAVKRLEIVALLPFAVHNVEHVFVTQDSDGNVFYMRFGPDTKQSIITLGIYGVTSMAKTTRAELQLLLQTKLLEQTAKALGAILTRNNSISLQYLQFLKNSGYAPRIRKLVLPAFVSDSYLFLSIVKQLFIVSPALSQITFQIPTPKKFVFAEHMHPSTIGYDMMVETTSLNLVENGNDVGFSTRRLRRRSSHVDVEDIDNANAEVFHPAFFGRSRRSLALSKEESDASAKTVFWAQNDFTFLYNNLGSVPASAPTYSKQIVKHSLQIGQGLALVELGFDSLSFVRTGSKFTVSNDVKNLKAYLKAGFGLPLFSGIDSDVDGSMTTNYSKDTTKSASDHARAVQLRIYPTTPMAEDKLEIFCESIFDHALYIYCVERLASAAIMNIELDDESDSQTVLTRRFTAARLHNDEILRSIHDLQYQVPPSIMRNTGMPSTGHQFFSILLQPQHAVVLHDTIVKAIEEAHPGLKKHSSSWNDTSEIFFSLARLHSTVRWKVDEAHSKDKFSSTLFGDVLGIPDDDTSTTSVTQTNVNEFRFIQDIDGQALPEWLRKRRFSLEITVCPLGLYVFYFNIVPSLIRFVMDKCVAAIAPIDAWRESTETENLHNLGIDLRVGSSYTATSFNPKLNKLPRNRLAALICDESEDTKRINGLLSRLSWQEKTTSRLYLKLKNKAPSDISKASPLISVASHIWRQGLLRSFQFYPLASHLHSPLLTAIAKVALTFDVEFIQTEAHLAFIIVPVPNTDCVYVIEIECINQKSGHIVISDKLQDLHNIFKSLGEETLFRSSYDSPFHAKCFSKYKHNNNLRNDITIEDMANHHLLIQLRRHITIEIFRHTVQPFDIESDFQSLSFDCLLNHIYILKFLPDSLTDLIICTEYSIEESFQLENDFFISEEFLLGGILKVFISGNEDRSFVCSTFCSNGKYREFQGYTFLYVDKGVANLLNVFCAKSSSFIIIQGNIRINDADDMQTVSEKLRIFWLNHCSEAIESYGKSKSWNSIFQFYSCDIGTICKIKEYSLMTPLKFLDKYIDAIEILFSSSAALESIQIDLLEFGPCFVNARLGYFFSSKKLFDQENVYLIGLLIEFTDGVLNVYLAEKDPTPQALNAAIEHYLGSVLMFILKETTRRRSTSKADSST